MMTKPVAPEWEEIERSIQKIFMNEGIELLLPVIPWDDDDDDEDPIPTDSKKMIDFSNLRQQYQHDLELMETVCSHTHSNRNIYTNRGFFEDLLQNLPVCRNSTPIDYIDVQKTSNEEFHQCHVTGRGRPAIIRGIPEVSGWRAAERWSSVEKLMYYYGHVPIKVGEVPPIHGMGRNYQIRIPLALYKEYSDQNQADCPFYGFEYDFSDARADFLDDYSPPEYFKLDFYDHDKRTRAFYPNNRHLIVGGERTGTNLHFDPKGTSAWNTLLLGNKKWAFFPPGNDMDYMKAIGSRTCLSGTAPGGPVGYWWLDVAPYCPKVGMIECVQQAGETVYIPAGWWHCVINLDFTMAITQNLLPPQSLPSCWNQLRKDWPKFSAYVENTSPELLENVPGLVLGPKMSENSLEEEEEAEILEFHRSQMQ